MYSFGANVKHGLVRHVYQFVRTSSASRQLFTVAAMDVDERRGKLPIQSRSPCLQDDEAGP